LKEPTDGDLRIFSRLVAYGIPDLCQASKDESLSGVLLSTRFYSVNSKISIWSWTRGAKVPPTELSLP